MRYMRLVILTIMVMLVEFGLSYFLAKTFNFRLLDIAFYIGLFFTIFFIFFSSTGGLPTNYSNVAIASSYSGIKNNYKVKRTFGSLSVNGFVLGSVLFFVTGFIIAFSI